MKIKDFADRFGIKVLTGQGQVDTEVQGVYVCDLLSWVMSHAGKGDLWITVHTHLNVVAVALLAEVACILIPEGIAVEEATLKKASEEGIVILSSDRSTYDLCCCAHEAGI